jgi:aspartate racemase
VAGRWPEHADSPTALAHVTAGRIDELADYLASFVSELRSVGATFFAIPAVTPHIALGPLTQRGVLPIVDMLKVTARGLRQRGFRRVALFGTRFTIETALFGGLDDFDVVPPRPQEIDEIHRVYLELAETGHTSAAGVKALRDIAQAIRRRDRVDAVVLAGTDLNLIFDEASAGFLRLTVPRLTSTRSLTEQHRPRDDGGTAVLLVALGRS